jgi:hypothetical protein
MISSSIEDTDLLRLSLRRDSRYITDWRDNENVLFALRVVVDLAMDLVRYQPSLYDKNIALTYSMNNGMSNVMQILTIFGLKGRRRVESVLLSPGRRGEGAVQIQRLMIVRRLLKE